MSERVSRLALLALLGGLAACGSLPSSSQDTTPYWQDQQWDQALFKAVQASIHYPPDAIDRGAGSVHGKVDFTYIDGRIEDPQLAESTGHPDLDAALIKQVAAANDLPKAKGTHATEPHAFELELDMRMPLEELEYTLQSAIHANMFYPKEAVMEGAQGTPSVNFQYLDGKASDVIIAKTSGDKFLDAAALRTVSTAKLPSPPPAFAGHPLNMQIAICYSLGSSGVCPKATEHVIQVLNTPGGTQ
jgi:TonB family protein